MGQSVSMYEAIANYLDVDEAEVIDNEDNETVTVFEMIYMVFPIEHIQSEFYWVIIPVN